MLISERVQSLIHMLEVGAGVRWLRFVLLTVSITALVVTYDVSAYRNFYALEPMDAAQVARNLAEGKGYTTDFIRPFSVYLVQKHNHQLHPGERPTTNALDFAQVNGSHPDLANPPVYPTLLAGLFKVAGFNWKVETHQPFWSVGGKFLRYQPEFCISILNQLLLVASVVMTFFIARKILDAPAAWLAALLTLGTEVLWRFSVSGQSTLLLLVIFLGVAWCLVRIEELGQTETVSIKKLFLFAIGTGLLVGLGMLTRYAFGWLIVPVAIFIGMFGGARRAGLAVSAFLAFMLVVTPWIIRNLAVSGTWFGTAGYAVVEGTFAFPGTRLMQSINPDMTSAYWVRPYTRKLFENLRIILQGDLLRVAGGWVMILFLAGLLLGLRQTSARRLRYFTMMCLGVLTVTQALGQTSLSFASPEINSENLLVLLAPLVVIFGVVFFLTMLEQMAMLSPEIRFGAVAMMVFVCCQPLITALLPPKISPVSYPPYYPPEIQKVSGWMRPDEMMMSDIPWAVAWYGHHQCVWNTINSQYEYFLFNDNVKQVRALYLTLNTLDKKLFTECLQGGVDSWGNFVLKSVAVNQIPPQFPLKVAPYGLMTGLFLTDRQRWDTE
jgi:4-amino-4-deoxy-L-arabinose transferase-like glycosyltransferase